MAALPTWERHLRLFFVTDYHIKMLTVDAGTGEGVAHVDLVEGYRGASK